MRLAKRQELAKLYLTEGEYMDTDVKCDICGLHVPAKDAVSIQPSTGDSYYVCKDCWRRFCDMESETFEHDNNLVDG